MASLKDIAAEAGVSVPTVSRILNPRTGRIPARLETIKKVRTIAKKYNYVPNAVARSLATNRTNNIALILDSLRDTPEENAFWSRVISGILRTCKHKSISCLLAIENYASIDNFELPMSVREKKVDGLIITHPLGEMDAQILDRFVNFDVPFVVISSYSTDPRICSVCCDPTFGFQQACLHLAQLGHRKIAYGIYPEWHAKENRQRMMPGPLPVQGYELDFVPIEIDTTRFGHQELGEQIADRIAGGDLDVTAIVMGDIISIQMIASLADRGIHVPKDISVVGLDDTYMCRFTQPKLSSLRSPLEEMGDAAVSLLLENIITRKQTPHPITKHLTLPKQFVIRDSTGPTAPR